MLIPYFIAACFSFGTATAKDIQTVLLTRFFAGFFGSAPVTNTGGKITCQVRSLPFLTQLPAGVLGDIWSPQQRGTAIVGYGKSTSHNSKYHTNNSSFCGCWRSHYWANCRGCHCAILSEMAVDRICTTSEIHPYITILTKVDYCYYDVVLPHP